jgi:hypothetical protein
MSDRRKIRGWVAGLAWMLSLAFCATLAAKEWKGATPGETKRPAVLEKFGKPTREFSGGGKLSDGLNYKNQQRIKGSKEANFYFDKNGVLFRIDVFPAQDIDRKKIEETYGKGFQERVTPKGFPFFLYEKDGLAVFFDKDGQKVLSVSFSAASGSPASTSPSPEKEP